MKYSLKNVWQEFAKIVHSTFSTQSTDLWLSESTYAGNHLGKLMHN